MLAKPTKVSKSALKAKTDKLASLYYRAQTPFCELAGLAGIDCAGLLSWCHIVSRSNLRLRYEPYNHLILCHNHHSFYTVNPTAWIEILQRHYPERLALAEQHRHEVVKVDYLGWIARFAPDPAHT